MTEIIMGLSESNALFNQKIIFNDKMQLYGSLAEQIELNQLLIIPIWSTQKLVGGLKLTRSKGNRLILGCHNAKIALERTVLFVTMTGR